VRPFYPIVTTLGYGIIKESKSFPELPSFISAPDKSEILLF
jgi:hypothetical protein